MVLLPLGEAVSRKRREKEALVENEVRRSDRIRNDNNGYRRKSCDVKACLPCSAIPLVIQNKMVKNLTKTFCKVSKEELEEKLSKRPKKNSQEDVAMVPKAARAGNHPKIV
mgnify:CR=1 FL=1